MIVILLSLFSQANFAQNGVPPESDRLSALRSRAEQGDSKAASDLGSSYLYNPTPDYAEALRWYQKGAAGGDAAARLALGNMYFYGQGVTKDYAEAARWYQCPKPDDQILSSCAEGTQVPLPPEALKAFRKLKVCNLHGGYGTAIALSADGTPVYSVSCYEYAHGEYLEVLIGKVAEGWKELGSGYGFWNCHNLLPLVSVHGGFRDVCLPNVCSLGTASGNKGCVPDIQDFRQGRYRSVSANTPDSRP